MHWLIIWCKRNIDLHWNWTLRLIIQCENASSKNAFRSPIVFFSWISQWKHSSKERLGQKNIEKNIINCQLLAKITFLQPINHFSKTFNDTEFHFQDFFQAIKKSLNQCNLLRLKLWLCWFHEFYKKNRQKYIFLRTPCDIYDFTSFYKRLAICPNIVKIHGRKQNCEFHLQFDKFFNVFTKSIIIVKLPLKSK